MSPVETLDDLDHAIRGASDWEETRDVLCNLIGYLRREQNPARVAAIRSVVDAAVMFVDAPAGEDSEEWSYLELAVDMLPDDIKRARFADVGASSSGSPAGGAHADTQGASRATGKLDEARRFAPPRTIPKGSRTIDGRVFTTEAELDGDLYCGGCADGIYLHVNQQQIDWHHYYRMERFDRTIGRTTSALSEAGKGEER